MYYMHKFSTYGIEEYYHKSNPDILKITLMSFAVSVRLKGHDTTRCLSSITMNQAYCTLLVYEINCHNI